MINTHWAQMQEVTFTTGMKVVFSLFRWFGVWPFRLVFYPIILFYVLTSPRARRASQMFWRNFDQYQNSDAKSVSFWRVYQHFISFGEAILDKLRVWSGELNLADVHFDNREAFLQSLASGKGGVVVVGHIGNMDMCRALSRARPGLRLTILVYTQHAQAFNNLLAEMNPDSGMDLMQVTEMTPDVAILLSQRVQNGEFVIIAGDRIPLSHKRRTVQVQFLGKPAELPIGPYVLAGLMECPLYFMVCLKSDSGFDVQLEPLALSVDMSKKNREKEFAHLAQLFADRVQHYVLKAPRQWFNFYDFWNQDSSASTH